MLPSQHLPGPVAQHPTGACPWNSVRWHGPCLKGKSHDSPAIVAAYPPDADVDDGLAVEEAVVQRVYQAHGVLLQDHHHVLSLEGETGGL